MSTPPIRIAFHTMGCKLNFAETSTLSREFIEHGYQRVSYKDIADIYVLNTCSVTDSADKEARKLIRQAKRRNPNSSLAVIGCYAQLKSKEIANIEGVDLVLGSEHKFNLLYHIEKINLNNNISVHWSEIKHVNHFRPSYSFGERTRSYLKIQDGCNYTCSFCTIPLARGKSRSGTIEDTMKTAQRIANTKKVKEIVITGVNIGDFGLHNGESLIQLLREMDELEYIERIRISSIEPNLLSDEIIEFCNGSKKFMPHFHIPLQSGSDRILKLMRRRYNADYFQTLIEKIKNINKDTCVGVDVIVGFPGENDSDFLATYEFLSSIDISYLHVFSYSERRNTDAYQYTNHVPKKNKSERSTILHNLSNKKRHTFYNKFLHQKRKVLYEGIKNGKVVGHTDNYVRVEVEPNPQLINSVQSTRLLNNLGDSLFGRI
tara:strand:- start:333 stop:1628 length:1296 start_codon:yes stop_codon:yes gene_type:complete